MSFGDEQVKRLMLALNVTSIDEVSDFIGVKSNTVSTWKKRGIPPKKILAIAPIAKCEPLWLEKGQGPMRRETIVESEQNYELNQDLMSMIYQCFDEYEAQNGKMSPIDRARISSSIYREYVGEATTLAEIGRAIRSLINYNK